MIEYRECKEFHPDGLRRLLLSVNWESGKYPKKFCEAMKESAYVISAWDDDRLIGLVRALSDHHTVAFLHYLLVDPAYQGMNIGDELMKRMMDNFKDLLYVKMIPSDSKTKPLYARYGFKEYDNYSAMVKKLFV